MSLHGEQIDNYLETTLDESIMETARLCEQPSVSAKGEGMGAWHVREAAAANG